MKTTVSQAARAIRRKIRRSTAKRASLLGAVLNGKVSRGLAEESLLANLRQRPETTRPDEIEIEIVYRMLRNLRVNKDDTGGNRWLHHRWVNILKELCEDLGGLDKVPDDFSYVCVGAGNRNPLAFPLLVFMAGAGRVHINEPLVIHETEMWRSIWGLQELVLRLLSGDLQSKFFVRPTEQLSEFLDLQALFSTEDISQILNSDQVTLSSVRFESSPIDDDSIDLLTSRSVLEHLIDYESCFDKFARVLRPGGTMYNDVDFSSHSNDDTFAFYYQSPRKRKKLEGSHLNELRLNDYLRMFEERGFENHVLRPQVREDYVLRTGRLEPRFLAYDRQDLICQRAVIVSRKK